MSTMILRSVTVSALLLHLMCMKKKTKFYSFLSRVPEGFITLISSFIGRYDKNGGIQISNIITCNFTIDYQSEEIL